MPIHNTIMYQGEQKPRFVGLNHLALEVDDIDAALAFYGFLFAFEQFTPHPHVDRIQYGSLAASPQLRGILLART